MKRWGVLLLLMLSVGVNLGLLLSRWTSRPAAAPVTAPAASLDPQPVGRLIDRMADELGLEGERRKRFATIQHRFFRTMVLGRRQLAQQQRAFYRVLAAPRLDEARIRRRGEAVMRAHGTLEKALAENVVATRAILDDDEDRRFLRMLARVQRHLKGQGRDEAKRRPRPDGIGRGEGGGEDVSFSQDGTDHPGDAFAVTP